VWQDGDERFISEADDVALSKRLFDLIDLPLAIEVFAQVLERATAAGAEVAARRRGTVRAGGDDVIKRPRMPSNSARTRSPGTV